MVIKNAIQINNRGVSIYSDNCCGVVLVNYNNFVVIWWNFFLQSHNGYLKRATTEQLLEVFNKVIFPKIN